MEQHIFDIWDSHDKKLYQNLNQQGMAAHCGLLLRNDCYLIQHIGKKAYNGRALRHGDIVRSLTKNETYVIAWDKGSYIFRGNNCERAIYLPETYEVLDNKFQQR